MAETPIIDPGILRREVERQIRNAGITDPIEIDAVAEAITGTTNPEGKSNMVENQHRKIKGYRELSGAEIEMMNIIKDKGKELGELVEQLQETQADQRWVAIGATQLQQGMMALTRAVAKPGFF